MCLVCRLNNWRYQNLNLLFKLQSNNILHVCTDVTNILYTHNLPPVFSLHHTHAALLQNPHKYCIYIGSKNIIRHEDYHIKILTYCFTHKNNI